MSVPVPFILSSYLYIINTAWPSGKAWTNLNSDEKCSTLVRSQIDRRANTETNIYTNSIDPICMSFTCERKLHNPEETSTDENANLTDRFELITFLLLKWPLHHQSISTVVFYF